jgi:hypothetical protein
MVMQEKSAKIISTEKSRPIPRDNARLFMKKELMTSRVNPDVPDVTPMSLSHA